MDTIVTGASSLKPSDPLCDRKVFTELQSFAEKNTRAIFFASVQFIDQSHKYVRMSPKYQQILTNRYCRIIDVVTIYRVLQL